MTGKTREEGLACARIHINLHRSRRNLPPRPQLDPALGRGAGVLGLRQDMITKAEHADELAKLVRSESCREELQTLAVEWRLHAMHLVEDDELDPLPPRAS
jgi:hypothetical protein